jgi:hypothetical protein
MATFPTRESDILVLAQSIIQGLTSQSSAFPKSPFDPSELRLQLDVFLRRRDALTALQAQAAEATAAKQEDLATLTDSMKAVLRYLEAAASSEDQLAHFGWSGRRAASPLKVPGQCRVLEAPRQGPGWVFLDWKEPADGGKPGFYLVECRELPDGDWKHALSVVESEATLTNQPRGKTLEFRVFARNKAGDGAPSNGVEVVV